MVVPLPRSHRSFCESPRYMDVTLASRGTAPVFDRRIWNRLKAISIKGIASADGDPLLRERFVDRYLEWIRSSRDVRVSGLESFPHSYYVNGVTQAYDLFLYEHKGRRFRMLKGEYPYVQLSVDRWQYLEDEDIAEGDAVILSVPSYRHGGVPRDWAATLDRCRTAGVPVFVDAAYFGTCFGVSFDFSDSAIEMIGFSLSKPFHIHSYRCGSLFSKRRVSLLEEIQVRSGYFNRVGAHVGMSLMDEFSPDYMPARYRDPYGKVCAALGVVPTRCLMLANVRDDDRRFDDILRDDRLEAAGLPSGVLRRVCVSGYLSDGPSGVRRAAHLAKRFVGRLRPTPPG